MLILDLFVKIADEGTAGHMAACDFVYWALFFFAGELVQGGDKADDTGLFQDLLNRVIVILAGNEGKQLLARAVLVFGDDGFRFLIQRHRYRFGVLLDGFLRDILNGIIDDVPLGQAHHIPYTTPYTALKYEDVPLHLEGWRVREIHGKNLIDLFRGKINRGSVKLPVSFFEADEGVLGDVTFLLAPIEESTKVFEDAGDPFLHCLYYRKHAAGAVHLSVCQKSAGMGKG